MHIFRSPSYNFEGDFIMNNNVIYIDYLDSYFDITKRKIPKWTKKCIYKIMNYFGVILKKDNELVLAAVENDIVNPRMLNKLYKILEFYNKKDLVCADRLMNNKEFLSRLKKRSYNVLDGSWLKSHLCELIIRKIAYIKNCLTSDFEISVLAKAKNDCNENFILMIAKECKLLNIITEDIKLFSDIERKLEDDGILINVSTNKDKGLIRSHIIVNFDFTEEDLCDCKFNGILVQLNNKKFERKKGITITGCRLRLPIVKSFNYLCNNNHFTDEIIYESNIFYKTSYENIKKILKRDNIQIRYFIGNNGKIAFSEFLT